MAIHQLNPRKVQTAEPGKHEDGGGLRLVVSPKGARKWVLRYTLNGSRREMGLGSYPDVTLATARVKAEACRKQLQEGSDPIALRRIGVESIPTFTSCAARYIRAHRSGWRNTRHARQWVSTLKTYARSQIGSKPVNSITTEDVLRILQPIWTSKTETAKRVQGRMENILDYAAAHKYRDVFNPARWQGHLDKLLPKPAKVRTVKHHPAIPYGEVPGFMLELLANGSMSALSLRMLILTVTRSSEVRLAKWEEVDVSLKVWTIPAERTKTKKEHRVPLSDSSIRLLESLPRYEGNSYVFPGAHKSKPLTNAAMLEIMIRMGYGDGGNRPRAVPHGFRSSFRDWSGEESNFPRDVAEMALGHVIENKVEAAYRRGDLFEKRRAMMEAWAHYVDNRLHRNANVVHANFSKSTN